MRCYGAEPPQSGWAGASAVPGAHTYGVAMLPSRPAAFSGTRSLRFAAMTATAVCALSAAAPAQGAALRTRSPTYREATGLLRAFGRDRGRLGLRRVKPAVTGIRVSRDGRFGAVFYLWWGKAPRRRARASRTSPALTRLLQSGSGDYDINRRTGEWKPDRKASEKLRGVRLTLWDLTYSGSGTDSVDAFRAGDPQASPYCHSPNENLSAGASFRFRMGWSELARGTGTRGSGGTTGHGTYSLTYQPGCVNVNDPPDFSTNNTSCSVDWASSPAAPPVPARISGDVDRHGNHELRAFAPVPEVQGGAYGCAAPDQWIYSTSNGPVVPAHSILIPDAKLAGTRSFSVKLGASHTDPSCFYLENGSRCSEGIKWSGSVTFVPAAFQGADRLTLDEGPEVEPGNPEGVSKPTPPKRPELIDDAFSGVLEVAGAVMFR